jgi:hypothetical protein
VSISWPPLLLSGSPSPAQSRYCRDANGNPAEPAWRGSVWPLLFVGRWGGQETRQRGRLFRARKSPDRGLLGRGSEVECRPRSLHVDLVPASVAGQGDILGRADPALSSQCIWPILIARHPAAERPAGEPHREHYEAQELRERYILDARWPQHRSPERRP